MKQEGVKYVFSLSGGAILPIYEPCAKEGIDELRREEEEKKLTEVQKKATEIAREILDQD